MEKPLFVIYPRTEDGLLLPTSYCLPCGEQTEVLTRIELAQMDGRLALKEATNEICGNCGKEIKKVDIAPLHSHVVTFRMNLKIEVNSHTRFEAEVHASNTLDTFDLRGATAEVTYDFDITDVSVAEGTL